MANTCSSCTNLNLDKEYSSCDCKYWCDKFHEWHYADEASCYDFTKAYSRSDSVATSYYNKSVESQNRNNSGCFITTIVCEILGKKDCDETLKKLRFFRDNYMHKDRKYCDILYTYDVVGPIIAENLRNDNNKKEIAQNLYNIGISKVAEYIDNKKYSKAVALYKSMTELLIEGYHINVPMLSNNIYMNQNYSLESTGHGKIYIKHM
ncbi:MAG TPA: hypothetical protein PLV83_05645 [Bacilli bacterium]|nr:hypothetical protein [Bacilli bacterium]